MAEAMPGMNPQPTPTIDQFAAFEEMRSTVSPSEFNETMLSAASEADPMAVAEFKSELRDLSLPEEVMTMLNTMVDEILAAPEQYADIRAKYMAQDIPDDLLPPTFDAEFFGALNLAIDEIRSTSGSPMLPPQGFARGGIASLRPLPAATMAQYGRNGDSMLAHINPSEMRMLRARGGSGTINPATGLPEFFSLKGVFKKIGNAVKKFAGTTIGKIVIGTALFFVAGPAAVAMFGSTAAPALLAATQGFVAGAGTALIGGSNLKDALKTGAIGAITAGAMTGITQGASAFRSTAPTAQAFPAGTSSLEGITRAPLVEGQALPDLGTIASDTAAQTFPAGTSSLEGLTRAPLPSSAAQTFPAGPSSLEGLTRAPLPNATQLTAAPSSAGAGVDTSGITGLPAARATDPTFRFYEAGTGAGTAPASSATALTKPPGFFESVKGAVTPGNDGVGFRQGLKDAFLPGKGPSVDDILADAGINPQNATPANRAWAAGKQTSALRRYAPLAAAGLGVMAATGGFKQENPEMPAGFEGMMDAPGQRLLQQNPEIYGLNFGGVRTTSATNPYLTYAPYRAAKGSGPEGISKKEFPRKNGPINGPGTGTSDDIPAMLSDGEFVFTAKAVRNMGDGSRRKGAKRMYALMKKLEGRANG